MNAELPVDGRGEDVGDTVGLLTQNVRIDPEGDRRVGVSEPGRDHVDVKPASRSVVAWKCRRSGNRVCGKPAWAMSFGINAVGVSVL
jgi:hypothetical protein